MKPSALRTRLDGFRGDWNTLGPYERFEQVVALAVATVLMALEFEHSIVSGRGASTSAR